MFEGGVAPLGPRSPFRAHYTRLITPLTLPVAPSSGYAVSAGPYQ